MDEIFEELAGFKDNTIRIDSNKPERIIQRLIITDRFQELIAVMADWCRNSNANPHLVRMAAHIVLCLRLVGLHYEKQTSDDILRSYVKVFGRQFSLLFKRRALDFCITVIYRF